MKISKLVRSILASLQEKGNELQSKIKFSGADDSLFTEINVQYKLLIEDMDLLIKYLDSKSEKDYKEFLSKYDKLFDELKKLFNDGENE